MRVYFEDKSYAEISKSPSRGKYFITVGARQEQEIIVNSAEVTKAELEQMLSDVFPAAKPKPKAAAKTKTTKKKTKSKKTTKKKSTTKSKPVEKPKSSTSNEKPSIDGYA